MSRLIPAAERIQKAHALILKARNESVPAEGVLLDLTYMATVKDLLQQARDLIKFIPYRPGATPEMKSDVADLFKEIDQTEKELFHRH